MDRRRDRFVDSLIEHSCVAIKWLQKFSKYRKNLMTEKPENAPFAKQGYPNLIRECGRTVGSGRVATTIE